MGPLDTAWVWAMTLAGILVFDAWLISGGHPSLSNWAGAHPVVSGVGCAGLCVHFNSHRLRVDRYDPLIRAAAVFKR